MNNQNSVEELKPPYILMNKALRSIDRDIVYSICEYGNGKVWEWGESVGGNLWRTTRDIWDSWDRMYEIGFGQVENAKYAGPGHWNDPDMLVVGWVGWGPNLHQSELTPDEQYTHVSLWSMLSAPLLLGNDLTKLDTFTLNLITNDEVIAIDQDKLGKQATPVIKTDDIQVWKKELSDGNIAIGIFNVSKENLEPGLQT
ncbi:MAG: glycoside hydrolase family 27 protein [Chlorobi bacterium]|nr:glycoside hydrolase family 27 protein [Chlorobiota bacterium]